MTRERILRFYSYIHNGLLTFRVGFFFVLFFFIFFGKKNCASDSRLSRRKELNKKYRAKSVYIRGYLCKDERLHVFFKREKIIPLIGGNNRKIYKRKLRDRFSLLSPANG